MLSKYLSVIFGLTLVKPFIVTQGAKMGERQ